ncbi:hypothetical protein NQ318_013545 [Aromia moschata]|uniref:Uncharacterized protein n=1 Tax=Aromia moschata TaxID=1265417 RepID=A0AAV8XZP6_9CUCU|nr:hypothetical protein NQ318_013545 [Aromia moschata]
MVPKLLTPEQNESRMNICADILNNIDTDPGLLDAVITCDDKIRKCRSGSLITNLVSELENSFFMGPHGAL